MPVRFLSDAELARLSSWPDEIAAEDLDSALHAPIPLSPSQVDSATVTICSTYLGWPLRITAASWSRSVQWHLLHAR